ncbi:unnamed protein product [Owenia fusiformis]|uniref:Uncharacterized protein n=1 Tax=Owenia fusiformis TaxID=6347 RepID=A0A8S4N216_OWEFU|nr:unnamed protein product [Owenia fusiformis]
MPKRKVVSHARQRLAERKAIRDEMTGAGRRREANARKQEARAVQVQKRADTQATKARQTEARRAARRAARPTNVVVRPTRYVTVTRNIPSSAQSGACNIPSSAQDGATNSVNGSGASVDRRPDGPVSTDSTSEKRTHIKRNAFLRLCVFLLVLFLIALTGIALTTVGVVKDDMALTVIGPLLLVIGIGTLVAVGILFYYKSRKTGFFSPSDITEHTNPSIRSTSIDINSSPTRTTAKISFIPASKDKPDNPTASGGSADPSKPPPGGEKHVAETASNLAPTAESSPPNSNERQDGFASATAPPNNIATAPSSSSPPPPSYTTVSEMPEGSNTHQTPHDRRDSREDIDVTNSPPSYSEAISRKSDV